jgi:hypothetical protein
VNEQDIAQQFYDIYKENKLKTKHTIHFCCSKSECYYLLYKIASTSPTLDKAKFYESPYFMSKGENIKERSLTKSVSIWNKEEPTKKKYIDKYFEDLGN